MSDVKVIKDLGIAVGLEWAIYENDRKARDARKRGCAYVKKSVLGETIQGVAKIGDLPRGTVGRATAGALMVAANHPNAVVYHKIDENVVWVCAIRDGMPLPGYDIVTNESNAQAVLSEALAYVHGADLIGSTQGARISLEQAVSGVSKRDAKTFRLVKPKTAAEVAIGVAALLMAIAATGGGLLYIQHKHDQELDEAASRNLLAEQLRSQEERRRMLARLTAEYQEQVRAMRLAAYETPSAARQFEAWLDAVRRLPLSINGWMVSSVECDPLECQAAWFRKDARAYVNDNALLPGVLVSADGNTAIKRLPVGLPVEKVAAANEVGRVTKDYLLAMEARAAWIKEGMKFTVSPESIFIPPPPEGVQGVACWKEGDWTLSGDMAKLSLIENLLRELSVKGVYATSVKFTYSNGLIKVISIKGKYRVEP